MRKFKNSLGTKAQCVFQTHGRKFQLSSLQMKFSSLVRVPKCRDGTEIVQLRNVMRKLKTVSERRRNVSFRHMEGNFS